ncbi:hypothetical protein F975_02470 [Acinetobacter sp. ANC 3789]|uniref:SDR family NAD(P)-dependent oxidoreductase n=1 Tax=Acinetobacter sp. ANC 3789 TaxID=1217714 RepID=UPI0002D0BCBE|nr:SDR family NAD(P)-dependent oxidoreductase [Acinetobacter sp. ANC 3789]ENU79841.1 hypothetical protein F975_02470 [Acinetobacter sp. ANC 3789]
MAAKVILITGASSGIGLATAELLHAEGFTVYGTSRRANNASKYKFQMIELDVNQEDSVAQAIEKVISTEGHIDVLINNAGFAIAPAGAEESSMQQAQAIFETNFFGALYSASKHALEGYSESLDHELRSHGIRVSLIEPAYTNTSLGMNLLKADAQVTAYEQIREKLHQQMIETIRNSDDPSIVANTILAVINSQNILPRYTSGTTARYLKNLRKFAPVKVFDKLIQRSLKV